MSSSVSAPAGRASARRAWLVCLGCGLALFTVMGLGINAFTVYQPYLLELEHFTNAQGSWITTVRSLFTLASLLTVNQLCARLGLGSVQDAIALTWDGDTPVWTVPLYGGTVLNDVVVDTLPVVATTRSGAFAKPEAGQAGPVTPVELQVPADAVKVKVAQAVKELSEAVNLEEAKVIVTGGRGMGSQENFALVEELAQLLGGVVGATRPAIEEGWVSRAHQVGQSGKIVSPALYIACGVSGATQHVSGMTGSGYVVAINKDEDAPIFDVADVGIVGDVMKVLPAARRSNPAGSASLPCPRHFARWHDGTKTTTHNGTPLVQPHRLVRRGAVFLNRPPSASS